MRIAYWIQKATDTHSEYVTLISFPRQQSLRERASILSYTHTGRIVWVRYFFYVRACSENEVPLYTSQPWHTNGSSVQYHNASVSRCSIESYCL